MGYEADVAANGLEVLVALRRQVYDVVLMDVQMPELDDLEATRALRREFPRAQQPRVIAMTANAMQEDRERCLAAGMDDYVSKPIRVEELVEALGKAPPLDADQAAQEEQVQSGGSEPLGPGDGHPEASEGGVAVFDPAAMEDLLAILGGEFAYLEEIIDSFLEDAPTLLAELDRFVEDANPAGAGRVAHSLKSNGADFGATAFSDLCREMETRGRSGEMNGAADLLLAIEAEYARLEAALIDVRRKGQIPGREPALHR